jgi:diaminohydroxyphosphoribosylaminopyrimidine deaminase/5-amino-6-(5-phosphoribosylamino)uracil reductase
MTADDRRYMQMALELAAKGRGATSPNPMVGAVLVKAGRVVGQGYHEAVGRAHAEVNAIADAGGQAAGATMYVTLEPCNHTGRTPPCTDAVLGAGISRVVVAMADPNPDVAGGGIERLRQSGVAVTTGVLEVEATRLNAAFVTFVRTRRPWVVLKWAATLDGRIATRTGHSRWVTGVAARREGHLLRNSLDAILVGVGTVIADDPRLTARLDGQAARDPLRIVLDTHLRTPLDARLLRLDSQAQTLIICADDAPADRRRALLDAGVEVASAPVRDGRIDLDALVAFLGARGITSVLIEGGSRVIASALSAGIVNRAVLFYAPKIMGGDDGFPVCRGRGPDTMDGCLRLVDWQVRRCGDDLLVEGGLDAAAVRHDPPTTGKADNDP